MYVLYLLSHNDYVNDDDDDDDDDSLIGITSAKDVVFQAIAAGKL